jgi:hypothetical protein
MPQDPTNSSATRLYLSYVARALSDMLRYFPLRTFSVCESKLSVCWRTLLAVVWYQAGGHIVVGWLGYPMIG